MKRFMRPFLFLLGILPALAAEPTVIPLPGDPACTAEDRKFMRRALELAQDSLARDWYPFSAVLVKDGQILAEYQNQSVVTRDVTKHAEPA